MATTLFCTVLLVRNGQRRDRANRRTVCAPHSVESMNFSRDVRRGINLQTRRRCFRQLGAQVQRTARSLAPTETFKNAIEYFIDQEIGILALLKKWDLKEMDESYLQSRRWPIVFTRGIYGPRG